jgi:tRNA A37 threonylcarbamoyladenosine synthetase subunit TsaC/SUA5/YrdC
MDKLLDIVRPDAANHSQREFWPAPATATVRRRAASRGLQPSTEMISLRLPKALLDSIKAAAKARDVPYQSLIKQWLAERLVERRRTSAPP